MFQSQTNNNSNYKCFNCKYIYQYTKLSGKILTWQTEPIFIAPYFNLKQAKYLDKKTKSLISNKGIVISELDTVLLYDWDIIREFKGVDFESKGEPIQHYIGRRLAIINSTGTLLNFKYYFYPNDSTLSKKYKIRHFEISNQSTENNLVLIDKDFKDVVLYFKKE